MFKHILTIIWNKRKSNLLLFLEILIAFLILFAVFSFVVQQMRNYQTPLGFDTENVWRVRMNFWESTDSAALVDMKQRLKEELLAQPEIEAASYSAFINPFDNSTWQSGSDDNGFDINTEGVWVDEDYPAVHGLNLVQGRWFTKDDMNGKYKPIVINQRLFDESFKGRNLKDSVYSMNQEDVKIIGVVDHFKYHGEFSEEPAVTFFSWYEDEKHMHNLNIRLKNNVPPIFEEKVSKIVAQITKRGDALITDVEKSRIQNSKETWIPIIALLSICGFLVLNVALGLFGVLWYNISKRKSEIGLRRTLGATQGEISTQFISEVLLVATFGILAGLFFAAQLPMMGVFEMDNINYYYGMLGSAALILVLVFICSFYPSYQAASVHPALALHEE